MTLQTEDVEVLDETQTGICGALGCTDPVDEVVRHPKHGKIYVCEDDGAGYDTVRKVVGGEQA